ncbi:two-component regulator propeller domain-containing protein, partial [Bacteroidota bacterium]
MKKISLLTALLITYCSLFIVQAQINDVKFEHYTVDDGLSQSNIYCVFQDSEGYLWFGTQAGLNKFDGYSFKKHYHNPLDVSSLSNGWIYSITEDASGNIWLATRSGLNKFTKKICEFTRFSSQAGNSNSIYSNLVYGVNRYDKYIVINTPPVLSLMNTETEEIIHYVNNLDINKQAGSLYALQVITDRQNNIWMATPIGLAKFSMQEKKFENYFHSHDDTTSLSDNGIITIYEDNQGDIWIGTVEGLHKYNTKENNFIRFEIKLKDNPVLSIIQDNSGSFWIGTYGDGLYKIILDKDKRKIVQVFNYSNNPNDENSLSDDRIFSLYLDKSNILWIGTSLGINKLDMKPKKFRLYKKTEAENSVNLIGNSIASVYKDKNNTLWIGNWGNGLNILIRKTGEVVHFSPDLHGKQKIVDGYVHVIFKDSKENVWISTRKGIQIFNKSDSSFTDLSDFLKINGLPEFQDVRINRIFEDSQNNIWIGSANGLFKIDQQNKKVDAYFAGNSSNSISDNLVYDITEDKNGALWVATNNGLNYYNPSSITFSQYFHNPNIKNSISNNGIQGLLMDSDGDLWIGTTSGLNLMKDGTSEFIYYSKKDGLPDEHIYDIIEDNSGKIWLSTNRGLAVLNKKTNKIESYDNEDGLQSLEFNNGASFKAEDGELFFGGLSGLNSFYPDSMPVNEFIPPIVLTSFEKSGKEGKVKKTVQDGDTLEVSYKDYEFVIEFAALDYTSTKKNQYTYRMKGLSDNWIKLGNRNFVAFSKLPPDKYTLSVRGSNNDGIWNMEGASITIIIKPPWWRTIIAYVIYIVLILTIIGIYIKVREKRLRATKKSLEEKVKKRTAEVVSQKMEIEEKNAELQTSNEEIESQKEELQAANEKLLELDKYKE